MADASNRRPRPTGPPLGGDRPIVYRRRPWYVRHRTLLAGIGTVFVLAGGTTAAVLGTRNFGSVPESVDASLNASLEASFDAPTASPSPTATTVRTTAPATPAPSRATIKGQVVTVVAPGRWTISVQQGLQLTVVTTPATTYEHHHAAGDVKQGSTLTVVGTVTAGVVTAASVTIEKGAT